MMFNFQNIGKIHHAQDHRNIILFHCNISQFSVDYLIKWYKIVLIYKVKRKHVSNVHLNYDQKQPLLSVLENMGSWNSTAP